MAAQTLLAPFTKLSRALKERGWKGTILQLYTIGDLKFGELKGTDRHGNKYYENLDLPYGQHRWIEYSNIHNMDPTMISPEWHGWMHHVYDETPAQVGSFDGKFTPISQISHASYNTHLGKIDEVVGQADKPQYNLSQFRLRAYKTGSLMTGPEDPDLYYKQPGHPLHPDVKKGMFSKTKAYESWDPQEEAK